METASRVKNVKDLNKSLFKILDSEDDDTSEAAILRKAAIIAILKFACVPTYEKSLSLVNFQKIAMMTKDIDVNVRTAVLDELGKGLSTVVELPLRYMCLLALYADDPVRKNQTTARKILKNCISVRRSFWNVHHKDKKNATQSPLLPENSMPYFVHLLAHFPPAQESMDRLFKYLNFYLPILLNKSNTYSFLVDMMNIILYTEDVQSPETSKEGIRRVAELTTIIVKELAGRKNFERETLGTAYLPPSIYKEPVQDVAVTEAHSYLPLDYSIPKRNKKDIDNLMKLKKSGKNKENNENEKSKKKRSREEGDPEAVKKRRIESTA